MFPTEIIRLDDAPRRLTKRVYLRLQAEALDRKTLEEARSLVESHSGRVPLYLCIRMKDGASVFLEPNDRYQITPTREFEKAMESRFGPGTIQVVADRQMPERPARKWERRAGSDGDGE